MADTTFTENLASTQNTALADGVALINREAKEKAVKRRAQELGFSYVDLEKTPLNPDFLKLVSTEESERARLLVIFRSGKDVRLAVENHEKPETVELINRLKGEGNEVRITLVSKEGMDSGLRFYNDSKNYIKQELVKSVDESKINTYAEELKDLDGLAEKLKTMTAGEGVNAINIAAMRSHATDVHYEPERDGVIVRFRIDGFLYEVMKISAGVYNNLINQLKYESKIQINVDSIPQDGRYVFQYNDEVIAVRVSSIPTSHGESFVCRFLRTPKAAMSFSDLGFEGMDLKRAESLKGLNNGMVLCTGPTGSGKTTTLYSLLSLLNTGQNKAITLEDPVEYSIGGVTQSQINEKRGYTFASGLKSVLRQDPDVIMLGEIRDSQTAQAATEAAMTGHILLSTLHTNSAIETVARLVDLGVERNMVASALDTVIAQRLVRRLCSSCGVMRGLSEEEKREFEKVLSADVPSEVPEAVGCDKCSNSGYRGRFAVVELFKVNEEIKGLILAGESSVKVIQAVRKSGFTTMYEDGLKKVARGMTTLEEVYRVTKR